MSLSTSPCGCCWVKLAPNDARIPQFRALAAWREQKPEIAVKHAEEALGKGADLYELRMGLAEYYAQPGKDAAKAQEHWRRAIALDRKSTRLNSSH